ncbi:MAG: hypothetical protein [Caudoviricetes sp.]|nr:MAG: hypothetical protein [Caudoviricetes sp.]
MPERKHDFAGWVTKNDIRCTDGIVIKQGAFKGNNKGKVPLVWMHGSGDVKNVLGHILLHNHKDGVYGYGYFNDTAEADNARELLKHGDINAMSIGANRIKKQGTDVVHGNIYEVSLVMTGANPGALIEQVLVHSDDGDRVEPDKFIIYNDLLIHSAEDVLFPEEIEGGKIEMADKTVGEVLDTLNEEQTAAVETMVASIIEEMEGEDETVKQSAIDEAVEAALLKHKDEDGSQMKYNAFNAQKSTAGGVILHNGAGEELTQADVLGEVMTGEITLKDAAIKHSITNLEVLFPDAKTVDNAPILYHDQQTSGAAIVAGTRKSPFARVKTIIADLSEDDARALGYIKGNEKLEQIFNLLHRETLPQTIYKKQKLDRDDIVDITDYNIIGFIQNEMRMMLIEELGRAILVGDGRANSDASKIKEGNIRPILTDEGLFTIKKDVNGVQGVFEAVIKALSEYQGSGTPGLIINPTLLADIKLLKDDNNKFLFGDIPSTEAVAARLGISGVITTTFLKGDNANKFVVVNLSDYTVGSTKGGEVTTFDDFDIDFNQYKYLIETRLSGALTIPKSAIAFTVKPFSASTTTTTTTKATILPTTTTTSTTTTTTTKA